MMSDLKNAVAQTLEAGLENDLFLPSRINLRIAKFTAMPGHEFRSRIQVMIDDLGDRSYNLRSIRRTVGHITTQYGLSLNHLSTLLPSQIAPSVFAEQCLGLQYTTIDCLKSQCRQGAHRYFSQVVFSPPKKDDAFTDIKSLHRAFARRQGIEYGGQGYQHWMARSDIGAGRKPAHEISSCDNE